MAPSPTGSAGSDEAAIVLEHRQGFGSAGSPRQVWTNCFEVMRTPHKQIQLYDVSFSEDKCREKRMVLTYCLQKENIMGDAGRFAVYDGSKLLYIPGDILPNVEHRVSEAVARGRPPREGQAPNLNQCIKIKHARTVNMALLAQFCQMQHGGKDTNIQDAINALNIAMMWHPSGLHATRRSSFFPMPANPNDQSLRRQLGSALEVWAGYFLSIRPGIGRMIMNFDRCAGTFKSPGSPSHVLDTLTSCRDPRDYELARAPAMRRLKITRFLKGMMCSVVVSRQADQKYKIRKVSIESAETFMFEVQPGQQRSVKDYIEEKYQLRLRHPYWPCVQVTRIAWYPLELVKLLPGAMSFAKLTPDQTNAMLKFTTVRPNDRLASLRAGTSQLAFNGAQSPVMGAWDFEVAEKPMPVKARLLPAPTLTYAGAQVRLQSEGVWDTKDKRSTKPGQPIERWAVVIFADENRYPLHNAQGAVTRFVEACNRFGMQIRNPQPRITHVGDVRGPDVRSRIVACCKQAGFGSASPPQLVLIMLANKQSPQYADIKTAGDVTLGFPTQVLLIEKLAKAGPQYWQNVALKVNVKRQGTNQILANGLPGFMRTPTMVFGADVTHPAPGSLLPSIAAVVGSHDPHGVEYTTEVRAQGSREEIILDLETIAYTLIRNFGTRTGRKPERLLFYRDGVSEGQFDEICRVEIAAIKRACARLRLTASLTYIICAKRHHIRLIPNTDQEADKSGNVKAGTVVDSEIAHPFYSDFYLMSHAGLLGTSRPTHYTVLLDEARLGPDQLQATTYGLAYLYPRATRSVSIAAPAYFAHHVAARARMHVGDDDSMSETSSNSPEAEDAQRAAKLQFAESKLKGVHENIRSSMYFM